ncbi:MAG: hypothetical protein J6X38_04665 [Abditibacteriota bacterium]|nr:hypothetical protein [Abditibacteriota bacterium]
MKKLIAILAVLALAMSAAFAAEAIEVDWESNSSTVNNVNDDGFSTEVQGGSPYLDDVWEGFIQGEWLLQPEDELTISVSGLEDYDWSGAGGLPVDWGGDGFLLNIYFGDGDKPYGEPDFTDFNVPIDITEPGDISDLLANGLTLTGAQIAELGGYPTPIGAPVYSFEFGVVNYTDNFSDGVNFTLNMSIAPADNEEEEPEVPEPATYAYAAMGLMSVLGMKRRIRK